MIRMLAVPFRFKQKEYCTLVRVKPKGNDMELCVTIMNGDLEKSFYGHHIFTYHDGILESNTLANDLELRQLQKQVGNALSEYVNTNPI